MYRRRKRTRVAPKARNKEEKCVTKRCRNRKALKFTYYTTPKGVTIKYEGFLKHCWKCKAKQLKTRHPATYVLNTIRSRARQRKIPFTITLAEFEEFCKRTNYLELRGREAGSASIDRIDHDKGYHIWNIQIRTFLENCTIGHFVPGKDLKQNHPVPEAFEYDFSGPEPELQPATADNPF